MAGPVRRVSHGFRTTAIRRPAARSPRFEKIARGPSLGVAFRAFCASRRVFGARSCPVEEGSDAQDIFFANPFCCAAGIARRFPKR